MFLKRKNYINPQTGNKVEAEAIILSIHRTGQYKDNKPEVKLQMQVQPEKGRNFITELNETLAGTNEEVLYTGAKLKVIYNPFNTREIELSKLAL
jgi:hypothetical protein